MKPRVTVLLLNWRRPANVRRLIEALRGQSCQPALFLWDNAGGADGSFGVDWQVTSGRNVGCGARWWMGCQADTEYVITFDDDLVPTDPRLLAYLVDWLGQRDDPRLLVGAAGRVLTPDLTYERCESLPGVWTEGVEGYRVDVVLGRVLLMRTALLRELSMPWGSDLLFRADDVVLSGLTAAGQPRRHWLSALFSERLAELPDDHALCRDAEHFATRERARRRYFTY